MRRLFQLFSWVALAGSILPPILYLTGRMTLDGAIFWLNCATVVWFIATPLWMGRPKEVT